MCTVVTLTYYQNNLGYYSRRVLLFVASYLHLSNCSNKNCSLNDNVQEFVPVSWFKSTETHGKTFNFFHDLCRNLVLLFLLFLLGTQWHLQ